MSDIDISNIDTATLLVALVKGSVVRMFGATPMTKENAHRLLDKKGNFNVDYVAGVPIKCRTTSSSSGSRHLSGAHLYDRDHGTGRCQEIVDELQPVKAKVLTNGVSDGV